MEKGSYVLATKYHDADPGDHWFIGFYDREEDGRHYVVDGDGNPSHGYCHGCGAEGPPEKTPEKSAASWNRRTK